MPAPISPCSDRRLAQAQDTTERLALLVVGP